ASARISANGSTCGATAGGGSTTPSNTNTVASAPAVDGSSETPSVSLLPSPSLSNAICAWLLIGPADVATTSASIRNVTAAPAASAPFQRTVLAAPNTVPAVAVASLKARPAGNASTSSSLAGS